MVTINVTSSGSTLPYNVKITGHLLYGNGTVDLTHHFNGSTPVPLHASHGSPPIVRLPKHV